MGKGVKVMEFRNKVNILDFKFTFDPSNNFITE